MKYYICSTNNLPIACLENGKCLLSHCCIQIFGRVCLGISILGSFSGDFYAHRSYRTTAEFSADSIRTLASSLLMEATGPEVEEEQGWAEAAVLMTCRARCWELSRATRVKLCSKSSFSWRSCGEGTRHVTGDAQPRAFTCVLIRYCFLAREEL